MPALLDGESDSDQPHFYYQADPRFQRQGPHAPSPQASYFPSFFFGALLFWFGVDIFSNWLIFSFWKLSFPEYILLLCR